MHRFCVIALALLATGTVQGGEVIITKDLAYLPEGRQEKLDLYRPAGEPPAGTLWPGVVIIHGGGWTGGDKGAKREINIGTTLASHGYVCISINYVLAKPGQPTWPTNLQDCKLAVRWLRKHANLYHIDPNHIGAIGGSAGGHLTAMLGVVGPEDGLEPMEDSAYSSRVQAAVPMYGAMLSSSPPMNLMLGSTKAEKPELYAQALATTHISKDDPPFLLLHGTADALVPVAQSEGFAKRLAEVGIEHQLVIIEGAPHTFDLQPKQRDLRPLVLGFFDKHLKPTVKTP